MTRSRLWLLAVVPILALVIVATQHFALAQSSDSGSLRGFTGCGDLHEHYVKLAVASAQEEQYIEEEAADDEFDTDLPQTGGDGDAMADDSDGFEREEAAEEESSAPSDEGEVSETGTNVQERGVDESDIIKTDGTHFYIL